MTPPNSATNLFSPPRSNSVSMAENPATDSSTASAYGQAMAQPAVICAAGSRMTPRPMAAASISVQPDW